jgi:hypothetical protein
MWSLIHPFAPFRSDHVTTQSRKISATVLLPNRNKLPTADSFAEFFWRNLPSSGRTPHRVGPTGQAPYQILVLTLMLTSFLVSRMGEGSFSGSMEGSCTSGWGETGWFLGELRFLVEEKLVESLVRLGLNHDEEKDPPQFDLPKFPLQLTSRGWVPMEKNDWIIWWWKFYQLMKHCVLV